MKIHGKMKEGNLGYRRELSWVGGVNNYIDNFSPLYSLLASEVRGYVEQMGIDDTAEADRITSQILERQISALSIHLWEWGWDSLKQLPITMVRVVAHYYKPLGGYCLVFMLMAFIFYIGANIMLFIWTKKIQPENLFCLLLMIFTLGNAVITEMLIRSIMRYVAYSFGLFYISGLLVFSALFKVKGRGVLNKARIDIEK